MIKINKKRNKLILSILVLFLLFIWVNNTTVFMSSERNSYNILAHRGLAQTFDVAQVGWDTNTASIIYEPEHDYLENTIESMRVAYEFGADVVEFDIHRTKDKQLAVFHDYLVDYRTEESGLVTDFTMSELRTLDIGYGYTADQGATYPFRGKGVGLMPSIDEVFAAFPDKELLIHNKDGDIETMELLLDYLKDMPQDRLQQITVYGDDLPIEYLRTQAPEIRVLSKAILKKALLKYELLGWTGYIPEEIKNIEIHIPLKYAKWLWGWPNKFVDRMESVGTRVVLVNGDGNWSAGFDSPEDFKLIPKKYNGFIWTNRVDLTYLEKSEEIQ